MLFLRTPQEDYFNLCFPCFSFNELDSKFFTIGHYSGVLRTLSKPLSAVNYFHKTLHHRCLTGFWIVRLCNDSEHTTNVNLGWFLSLSGPLDLFESEIHRKLSSIIHNYRDENYHKIQFPQNISMNCNS